MCCAITRLTVPFKLSKQIDDDASVKLDFANETQDILNSFQPYYELTTVDTTTDPSHLYDLETEIKKAQVICDTEVENTASDTITTQSTQEGFKNSLQSFVRWYSFLTQIMPFTDVGLEKLYTYSKFLLKALPRNSSDRFQLGDGVSLEYYR